MESNQNINCHFSQNSSNESNCNLAENKIEKNPENPKPKIEVKSENSISQNFENYKRSEHSSSGLPRKLSLGENDIKSGKEESEKKLDKTSEIKENENNTSQTIDLTTAIEEMRKELNSTKDVLSKKLDLQNQQINGLRKDFKDELKGLRKDFKDELIGLRTELSSDLKEIINLLKNNK